QIDFKAETIRLWYGTTKNDEGRTFPFGRFPALKALLLRQKERTDAWQRVTGQIIPWVFHRNGKRIKDFRKSWAKACEAAGLPNRIQHDFRRYSEFRTITG
ncbi:MAG: site-specific integrase, partial [Planctomycetota bacterium]